MGRTRPNDWVHKFTAKQNTTKRNGERYLPMGATTTSSAVELGYRGSISLQPSETK
jgi:hypothetical protein